MSLRTAKLRINVENDIAILEEGDLIEFERGIYSHWAVYEGKGKVVHLTGVDDGPIQSNTGHSFSICGTQFDKACVKEDNFWHVASGSKAYRNNTNDSTLKPRSKREIVSEARSMIGNVRYNIITKNCEHFATFCRYGEERSDQVRNFGATVGVGVGLGALAIGLFGSGKDNRN